MIIWINGSFGVGKTTIASELNKQIKEPIVKEITKTIMEIAIA